MNHTRYIKINALKCVHFAENTNNYSGFPPFFILEGEVIDTGYVAVNLELYTNFKKSEDENILQILMKIFNFDYFNTQPYVNDEKQIYSKVVPNKPTHLAARDVRTRKTN